ncbi:MAG: periplasmic heavy metal sensor [Planctomycetota bacterium]|nr:periplasmic heavy metal sensor [Planctomycetota bacterium]
MAIARKKIIFYFTVLLMLGAGVLVGRLSARLPGPPPPPGRMPQPWLVAELNLTPQQQQQMDALWADVRKKNEHIFDQRHQLQQQRDDDIHRLLTPEQQSTYDKIQQEFRNNADAMNHEFEKSIADANQHSREMLDDAQKKTWDKITSQRMRDRRGPRGPSTQRSSTRFDGPPEHDRF